MTGIEELALVAAAVSAAGTVYASNQQANAEEYNANVMDKNAMIARSQASAREDAQRQHARQVIGAQLAATSQSGSGLTGSNLDLLHDSLYNREMDALNIRYEGELKASGLNDQAKLDRYSADNTRTGGYISATGKLIGGSVSYLNSGGTVPYNVGGLHYNRDGSFVATGGYSD